MIEKLLLVGYAIRFECKETRQQYYRPTKGWQKRKSPCYILTIISIKYHGLKQSNRYILLIKHLNSKTTNKGLIWHILLST